MTREESLRHRGEVVKETLNTFAREVRERGLCPGCATAFLMDAIEALVDNGCIKHFECYAPEERAESAFFNEIDLIAEVIPMAGGTQH